MMTKAENVEKRVKIEVYRKNNRSQRSSYRGGDQVFVEPQQDRNNTASMQHIVQDSQVKQAGKALFVKPTSVSHNNSSIMIRIPSIDESQPRRKRSLAKRLNVL